MALSPEQLNLFLNYLKEKQKNTLVCPVCGSTHWTVDGPFSLLMFDNPEQPSIFSAKEAPMVVVFCANCCYAMNFSWKMILDKQGAK